MVIRRMVGPSGWCEPRAMTEAVERQKRLRQLQAERQLASIEGLAGDRAYMADLEDEIETMRHAYVGSAVAEIALLRAELSGRLVG
jgi:hypothetical protein